jgi:hypothetical protein
MQTRRREASAEYAGKEIFEIKPVILGGSPTDPANKTVLDRASHIKAVRYWNRVIRQLREQQRSN